MYGPARGLGSTPSCNWTDEFGYSTEDPNYFCGAPGSIAAFDIAADARSVLAGGSSFTAFVNKNAKLLGIGAAAILGFMLISKR